MHWYLSFPILGFLGIWWLRAIIRVPTPQFRRRIPPMPNTRKAHGNDLVDIAGELRAETERAYRFFDGSVTEWLPKSQCEWDAADKTMSMPSWLALEKGFL
jgi:hypothetical protein